MVFKMVIILSVLIFLYICYWGVPFISLKKKGYISPKDETLSNEVKPVFQKNNGMGVLLIHGFEGSSYEMKELGNFLSSMGFTISIPLLPGHGTSINDLVHTDFKIWYNHVKNEYIKLNSLSEKTYIIGLSLGGLLALKIAQDFQPNGLITISAPVFFNGYYNGKFIFSDLRLLFSGLITLFIKKLKAKRLKNDICPWEGYRDYHAVNCVHSVKISMPHVRRKLFKITSPICVIHAQNDKTIPIENFYYILRSVHSTEKRGFSFLIPTNVSTNHVLTTHKMVKKKVFSYIIDFINDCEKNFQKNPEKQIGFRNSIKRFMKRVFKRVKGLK